MSEINEENEKNQNIAIVLITIGAVLITLFFAIVTDGNHGFWMRSFAFIVGSVLGIIGGLVGDCIRKIALPDGYITSGGIFSILKIKLFWAIGPQVVGVCIGAVVGTALVIGN